MSAKLIFSGKMLGILLITLLYLALGLFDLHKDVINPDGINWHNRTQAFVKSLKEKDYSETFQVYHPGITLMWVSGPLLNIIHNNQPVETDTNAQKASFVTRDYYAKLSLVVFSTVIFFITYIYLWKLVSFKYSVFFSLPFVLEPFILGMRRLYHLDYLMAVLMFLSVVLLVYYNYKAPKFYLIPLSSIFLALAILTKSTAVMIVPTIPFIVLLGNSVFYKKILALIFFCFSLVLFIYAFFPALWKNPIKSFPKYIDRIAFGVTDIGVEGKKEIGASGKSDNITLDSTLSEKSSNFYLASLFMRLSPAGAVILTVSLGVFLYIFLKGFVLIIYRCIKFRKFPLRFEFSSEAWLAFWSLGIACAVLLGLTFATKKSDRYEIIVFPFLITLIALFLQRFNKWLSIVTICVYLVFVALELKSIHPYYMAYSNPYLGGLKVRLSALDDAPFGIGSYEAFQIVKRDLEKNGNSGYYTISGSKSIKAISVGSKFSRFPSCVTDYVIAFGLEEKPVNTCVQRYELIGTVKISGFDYMNVYKRLNQRHESNYE
jgi:hypothetical protein